MIDKLGRNKYLKAFGDKISTNSDFEAELLKGLLPVVVNKVIQRVVEGILQGSDL